MSLQLLYYDKHNLYAFRNLTLPHISRPVSLYFDHEVSHVLKLPSEVMLILSCKVISKLCYKNIKVLRLQYCFSSWQKNASIHVFYKIVIHFL